MAVRYVSDGSPDGTVLGQDASDLVGLHGATPVAQASAIATAASSLGSVKAKLNSVLTALRNKGFIAS